LPLVPFRRVPQRVLFRRSCRSYHSAARTVPQLLPLVPFRRVPQRVLFPSLGHSIARTIPQLSFTYYSATRTILQLVRAAQAAEWYGLGNGTSSGILDTTLSLMPIEVLPLLVLDFLFPIARELCGQAKCAGTFWVGIVRAWELCGQAKCAGTFWRWNCAGMVIVRAGEVCGHILALKLCGHGNCAAKIPSQNMHAQLTCSARGDIAPHRLLAATLHTHEYSCLPERVGMTSSSLFFTLGSTRSVASCMLAQFPANPAKMCMHNSHARTIPLQTRGPAGLHYPHARTLLLALPAYNSLHVPVPCREHSRPDISPTSTSHLDIPLNM